MPRKGVTKKGTSGRQSAKVEQAKALTHNTSEFSFKDTSEIKVSKSIIDQVIGQEDAVAVMHKASLQRRHVLLIGEPGTGKSMLGLALAEMLPKEKLVDIVAFPNPNDENQPLVRTLKAGEGRQLVTKAKYQGQGMMQNQLIITILVILAAVFLTHFTFNLSI